MKRTGSVLSALASAMLYLATAALLVMTALVTAAAIMRYVARRPLDFTEDLVALLYMAMVFLALPIATVRRAHISISVLPKRIMTLLRHPLRLAASLAMIAYCSWFTLAAFRFASQSLWLSAKSEQANILLWPWMAIMPIAMGFVVVISILHLMQTATGEPDDTEQAAGDGL